MTKFHRGKARILNHVGRKYEMLCYDRIYSSADFSLIYRTVNIFAWVGLLKKHACAAIVHECRRLLKNCMSIHEPESENGTMHNLQKFNGADTIKIID